MNPKISVILPVYDGEKYLRECLNSIIVQTLDDYELICVNDGSSDATGTILSDYASRDPRIRILNQKNAGYGRAMNHGIEQAEGTYIAVVESDDYIHKDMLQTLYTSAEQTQADVVKADFYMFSGEGKTRQFTYMQTPPDRRLYGRLMDSTQSTALYYAVQMTWTGIYRRNFLQEHHIQHNETRGAAFQDNGFWFQIFTKANRVFFINEALYYYRVDNLTASTRQSNRTKVLQIFDEYDFILRFLKDDPERYNRLYLTYLHFRFTNTLSRFYLASDDCKLEIAQRIHRELHEAVHQKGFSWDLYGLALRERLQKLLLDPVAFVENPQNSINELCWQEVTERRESLSINPNVAIPAWIITDYLDCL
jgi:glycosyltransferase involved in cell wall biosynthesis